MVPQNLFFSLDRYAHKELWKETLWSPLQQMEGFFKKISFRIEIDILEGVFLENSDRISIGKGTIVEPGVYIQGPCVIGNNCMIRHGAYLRGSVICGDRCSIGHCSEIKNSILLDDANATHFVYVGDSILGNGVNLGAGVKCANLRLDRKEVNLYFEGTKYKTGLKKLGAIIGDGVQIGCNCVLNPGTLIGKESSALPLLNLGGYIPPKSRIKSSLKPGVKILKQLISK